MSHTNLSALTQISQWEALNGHEQIADGCAGETLVDSYNFLGNLTYLEQAFPFQQSLLSNLIWTLIPLPH